MPATPSSGARWRSSCSSASTPADETFRARFAAEARHAAALHHPGIASVFDYGVLEETGTPYLVMELVDGLPLADLIAQGRDIDPEQARLLGLQIAEALAVAHAAGVVHRDVKPANILVTPEGQVKITDFGIARAIGSATFTQTGEVIGTPHYLSPEQARGEPATAASDVYGARGGALRVPQRPAPLRGRQPGRHGPRAHPEGRPAAACVGARRPGGRGAALPGQGPGRPLRRRRPAGRRPAQRDRLAARAPPRWSPCTGGGRRDPGDGRDRPRPGAGRAARAGREVDELQVADLPPRRRGCGPARVAAHRLAVVLGRHDRHRPAERHPELRSPLGGPAGRAAAGDRRRQPRRLHRGAGRRGGGDPPGSRPEDPHPGEGQPRRREGRHRRRPRSHRDPRQGFAGHDPGVGRPAARTRGARDLGAPGPGGERRPRGQPGQRERDKKNDKGGGNGRTTPGTGHGRETRARSRRRRARAPARGLSR